ncbi:META domain-containing protein [Actinokineospora soli]|uniref:META domain-containing protein n=1 Tax=Actinokineospora soli TaxID=1048753 RepID=A0ABW2TLJ0_9PSEU
MKILVSASLLLVALVACGQPVGIGPAASGPTGAYTSQSGRDLVPGTAIRLDFTGDGRLVANAGCNTIAGGVDTGGGKLAVKDLSTTEMGCDQPRHAQDEWLSGFLGASPEWRVDGDRLLLSAQGTELVFARPVAPPLIGTTWVVDTLLSGDVASSVPVEATLKFDATTVFIETGCNSGSGGTGSAGTPSCSTHPV